MLRGIINSPRTRLVALAVGLGVAGSLATAGPSAAVTLPNGIPLAGGNCQANAGTINGSSIGSGKISGRGSTLQAWLQYDLINAFTADVCGNVPADTATNPYSTQPACATAGSPPEPTTADPSDPSGAIDLCTQVGPPAIPGLVPPTYGGDMMIAYNYPSAQDNSATGSGEGQTTISCRDDAFSGTDLPYATADITNIDGAEGAQTSGSHPCAHTNWVSPYQTGGSVGGGNTAGRAMSIPIGVSAVALPVNLPAACYNTVGNGMQLSTSDVLNIWGGLYTNWNQITGGGPNFNATACNFPIVRVVRADGNSGTTQGFLNYLNDANAAQGTSTATCGPGNDGSKHTDSFLHLDLNANGDQGYGGENNVWPGNPNNNIANPLTDANCSYVVRAAVSGGPYLLHTLATIDAVSTQNPNGTTVGGIGYADLSDVGRDPGDQGSLVIPQITNSQGGLSFPSTSTAASGQMATGNGSNCTFNGGANDTSLPVASGIGLTGAPTSGDWGLDAGGVNPLSQINPADDVAWNAQGASYPICSLTWDFVFAGEDGNNKGTVSGTQTLPTSGNNLLLTSIPAGTATQGVAEISSPNELITYNGITGNALDNVTGGFGRVLTGKTVILPNASGGLGTGTNGGVTTADVNPEPQLNANQRRSVYQYFSYVLSDPAQSTELTSGYAQLPEGWLSPLRAQFQSAFSTQQRIQGLAASAPAEAATATSTSVT